MKRVLRAATLVLAAALAPLAGFGQAPVIGVVVMHGKASSPHKAVRSLASGLEAQGMRVANLDMPWSGRREYDVDLDAAVQEVGKALEGLRAQGATRLFVAGHSQGGLFAVLYAGRHEVDGVVAIAPGGQVDTPGFTRALGKHVAKAREMRAAGRGGDSAAFGDFEGGRGVTSVRTSADIYLSWFDPAGAHTSGAFRQVKAGTPVLYVAPTRDHPGLQRFSGSNFAALPAHPRNRMLQPDTDHMGAPSAVVQDVAAWIREVAAD